MKKLMAIATTVAVMLAFAGTAEAKAPAPGSISIYGAGPISPTKLIAFGQLFSNRSTCVAKRRFKLFVRTPGGKVTVDQGRTSAEGGISGLVNADELTGTTGAGFVAAKTSKCAKVNAELDGGRIAMSKPASTDVEVLTVDGDGPDGAFTGIVKASKGSCKSNRKVKFLVDGDKIDSGTTTDEGSWALHVTSDEFESGGTFKAVVKKTSKCGGAKATFEPLKLRPNWR